MCFSGTNKKALSQHGSIGPFISTFPAWPSARNTAFVGYIYNDVYSVDLYVSLEIYSFCSFKNT